MNDEEFDEWIRFHCGCFPDYGNSLAKSLGDIGVLETWRDALAGVSLADAREATRRMIAEADLQPEGWSKHPAAIKDIALTIWNERAAKSPKRKYVDGREVFDCHHCRDSGTVTILSPRFVEAVRRELITREPFDVPATSKMAGGNNWRWGWFFSKRAKEPNQIVRASCFALACCCHRGRPEHFNGAKFSPSEHYAGDVPITPDELQRFEQFLQSLDELAPANYQSGFDEWNSQ